MNMKIYSILLLCCSIQMIVAVDSNSTDNAAKCAELEAQGDPLLRQCQISETDNSEVTVDSVVEQLRCLWKGLKVIPVVMDQIEVCEPLYPNDNELLCGIQVLFCVVDRLAEACPVDKDDNTA